MAIVRIAAHIIGHAEDGYIQYNTDTKEVQSHLRHPELDQKVVEYLTTERAMHQYTSLSQYQTISAVPASSLDTLKLALCNIWVALGVHIDWSRPVEDALSK